MALGIRIDFIDNTLPSFLPSFLLERIIENDGGESAPRQLLCADPRVLSRPDNRTRVQIQRDLI